MQGGIPSDLSQIATIGGFHHLLLSKKKLEGMFILKSL